ILSRPRASSFVWARVIGDLMDLALLGKSFKSGDHERGRLLSTTAAVGGVTLLDAFTAMQLSRGGALGELRERRRSRAISREEGVHVAKAITLNRPLDEVYAFWRDLENLPRFMDHLESVRV